jgi:hypothetical protein
MLVFHPAWSVVSKRFLQLANRPLKDLLRRFRGRFGLQHFLLAHNLLWTAAMNGVPTFRRLLCRP